MSRERHQRISDLFLQACALDLHEREELLEHECAGDSELRAEVESLLAHDPEASDVLKTGAGAALADERPPTAELDAPDAPDIPGHRILRPLGEGGMGTVYLAEDIALGRQVAVKIISGAMTANGTATERFVHEARVMAKLRHPHIVQVHSLGHTDEGHYLVMEYVDGESLARRVQRAHRLGADEALRILRQTQARSKETV